MDTNIIIENLDELEKGRSGNMFRYLENRKIGIDTLRGLVKEFVAEGDTWLLSSSSVYGLYTSKSDLDFYQLTRDPNIKNALTPPLTRWNPTVRFDLHRCSWKEMESVLQNLKHVSALDTKHILQALSEWKKHFDPLSPKMFERLINAVTFDGEMIFKEHIPRMACIWTVDYLFRAIKNLFYAEIAYISCMEAAVQAYLLNGYIYLMNAWLASEGYFHDNKKHMLPAWKKERLKNTAHQIKLDTSFHEFVGSKKSCREYIEAFRVMIMDYENAIGYDMLRYCCIRQNIGHETHKLMEDLYLIAYEDHFFYVREDPKNYEEIYCDINMLQRAQDPRHRDILNMFQANLLQISYNTR